MSDIALKHYEISLWDDVLTWAWKEPNSEEWTIDTNPPEGVDPSTIIKQFFDEVKLCIIGSDQMVSYAKANNPVFTENTNGQKTLTFSLVARYFDEDLQDYVQNPFINLLVNERKVKLYYNDEWFDLIIKNIQENKGSNSYSYTAQSAAINELSKTGFNLEFDTELQNNMGKITDLAAKVVEGTDWVIDVNNSDPLTQYIEEPIYSFTTTNCSAIDTLTGNTVTLPNTAYVFYSQLQPQNDGSYLNPFQAINPTIQGNNPLLNDDRILVKENGDYAQNITVTATEVPVQAELTDYRGMRLNRHQSAVFDSKLNRYVNVYSTNIAGVNTVYGYTETKYISPVIVQDFVTNGIDFTSTGGWACNGNDSLRLGFEKEPVTNAYLDFKPNTASNWLYNSGIYDMRSQIHEFTADTSYIMRIDSNIISFTDNASTDFTAVVAPYSLTNGAYNVTTNEAILTFSNWTRDNGYTSIVTPDAWDANVSYYTQVNTGEYTQVNTQEQTTPQAGIQYYIQNKTYAKAVASCQYSLSYQDLLRSTPGLFIKANNETNWKLYELQFYQQVTVNGRDLVPGDPPTQDILEFVPRYYNPEQEYEKADDLEFLSNDATYTPVYDDNYEKIRSIVIKESNRYNIIQTLCETFECWARFNVAHDSTGKIVLDENLVPIKSISFHEYIGDDNYAGFRYKVNLKDIQRTLVSDQLVTKIVVKANSNEFAPHGFCTIARAQENPTKENFLLDFIHYIRHGLLSNTELTNDLYLEQNGYIGYYKKLAEYNRERDEKIELLTQLQTTQNQLTAALQVAELASASAEKLLNDAIGDWRRFKGTEYVRYNPSEASEMGQQIQTTIEVQRKAAENWSARAFSLDLQSKDNQEKIDDIKHYLYEETEGIENETLYSKKKELEAQFYKKYSRFIQEGSWISEDYVDDNLYFIDAQNTLRTSAEPQVTYNISVMALDALDEYKSYNFKIGDKTYVEDEEFFGYVPGAPVQTPYHEEVIVSQVQWSLDNPANNNITVQNFKTRFQDLFQRITAQTQSLQYNNGAYQKAAMVVTTDGAITESALGKALIDSTLVLSNAQDQSVVIDNSGITITDLTNYREIVRLVSGGILLSNDGGQSWSNAITGDGINANYITAGQIDTAIIRVGSGAWPSFRWDSNGLAAYAFDTDEHGNPQNFLFNKLVRFDQYGLYGYIGQSDFVPASLSDVINNAQFSLTWDGFQIKSNNGGGYIRISSNDDIQVYDNAHERIKIGRISADNAVPTIYGIKISNDDGAPVLVTDSDGNLWLENLLKVGDGTNSSVNIGYNTSDDEADTYEGAHEVINANDTFIVYENGHIKATSAEVEGTIIATDGIFRGTVYAEDGSFNGRIYATGGQIGGLSLDSIVSLGDAAMVFDANGLTVKNSNFRIQRTSGDEEPVDLLYFDTDDQVLKIIGNGVFTGTIHATEGDFIGTITATNGNIKYLKIGDEPYLELGEVYDENNNLVFQGIRSNNQAFSIDTNGSVVANDIHLGTGAVIEQFIELGTAKILNPASNKDGTILQAGNVKLNQDGTGVIGDLRFNGETSTLSGERWFITPDLASFSNIYVEGEISTSVFTANETRASGGSMIFKTGSIIQEIIVDNGISTLTLTQKEISAFEEGDYVIITKDGDGLKNSVVARVQELNLDTYKITVPVEVSTEANLLINLGEVDNNNVFDDWLIGVNSTDNPISKIGLHQNALSMNQLSLENGEVKFEEQVVLGDLTGLKYGFDNNSLTGSGLYAQNVYLTGALATQYKLEYIPILAASEVPTFELDTYYKKVGDDYVLLETEPDDWETNYTNYYIKDEIQYAGVSTYFNDSSVPFAKSTELTNVGLKGDTSPIVFWAGATGLDKIQDAPFQVTSNGTLYAQQGYFEGSILTKATIEASELVAPLITGKATGEDNWLLTLKTERVNSKLGLQGFRFIGLDDDSNIIEFTTITSEKAHFNNDIQLSSSNFINFDDESFVKITNEDIEAKTYLAKNAINSETNTQLGVLINGSQIAFQQQQSNLGSWDELGRIDYIVDTFYVYNGGVKEIEITKTGFASKEQTYLDKDVYMGIAGSSNALFYKNNTEGEGYDLYVGSAR